MSRAGDVRGGRLLILPGVSRCAEIRELFGSSRLTRDGPVGTEVVTALSVYYNYKGLYLVPVHDCYQSRSVTTYLGRRSSRLLPPVYGVRVLDPDL